MTPSKTEHELEELLRASVNALPALLAERKQLREGLKHMIEMWDMRRSIDPGIVRGRGAIVKQARSLLAEQEATDEQPGSYEIDDGERVWKFSGEEADR